MSEPDNRFLDIFVDKSIYSLSATKRAVHRFTDAFLVEISDKDTALGVRLTSRNGQAIDAEVHARFHTTLLDESLRETVLLETRGIRDTLIAVAFGNSKPRSASEESGS